VALLLDEASGQLVPRRARHREGQPRHAIALSRTLLAEVVEQQAAVLCDDAAADQRFNASQSVIAHNFRSVLVVPFLDGGRVMGAIHLDSSLATGIFTQRDLRLLVGFAGQVALTLATHRLAHQMEEQTRVRDRLERMLSPNLVQEVVAGKLEVKKGGEQRRATVLFSDIRGFTSRTERTEPRFLVALLNDYFELMVDIVFKYQGTLDKYVGDEVMAVWGAPVAQADDPQRAVGAALDMMYTLSVFNSEMGRKYPGFEPLSIGIGIHTGDVISGYMGSTKTMQYTVIGDSVNTGARFCSAAAPGEILVCEATARACEGAFRFEPLPPKPLKGKSAPVPVFRVLGRA
jgi:adenylate cyclase